MLVEIHEATQILERTPATLQAFLGGLDESWTGVDEGEDTWSPFDVVGHLIHGERADWMQRLRIILESGESRPFEPFDRFAMFEESRGRSLGELLAEFAALRKKNLEALLGLDLKAEDLSRKGLHPELGPVTLGHLISTWVVHDLAHVVQIARVMSRRLSEAVGPWREYLPVLTR